MNIIDQFVQKLAIAASSSWVLTARGGRFHPHTSYRDLLASSLVLYTVLMLRSPVIAGARAAPPDSRFSVHVSVCLSFLYSLTIPIRFPEPSGKGCTMGESSLSNQHNANPFQACL